MRRMPRKIRVAHGGCEQKMFTPGEFVIAIRSAEDMSCTQQETHDVLLHRSSSSNMAMCKMNAHLCRKLTYLRTFFHTRRHALTKCPRVRQVVTPMDAPESQPKHAAASHLPGFSPCQRPLAMTVPCSSVSPVYPGSCANPPRFELPFVELRFCPAAGLATGTIGPHTPLRPLILPATRSFAGSEHSAR